MFIVLISEFIDEAALDGFASDVEVRYRPELVDDRPALLAEIPDCDALIVRNRTQVDAELLSDASRLRVVGRLGVGLDNIDLDVCAARDIAVCPATGANAISVAEYVVAATLLLLRGAYAASGSVIAGEWPRQALIGGEAAGLTMGLYGYGLIAREVGKRAAALGMRVAAHDPFLAADDPAWRDAERCDAAALLTRSDVLSLHAPLTEETRNLIDANAIAAMKPGAILINTARGGIVDEAAAATALRSGALGGAALDVFSEEPLNAEAGRLFAGAPNLILTPHIAGVTREANARVSAVTVANVAAALSRQPGAR